MSHNKNDNSEDNKNVDSLIALLKSIADPSLKNTLIYILKNFVISQEFLDGLIVLSTYPDARKALLNYLDALDNHMKEHPTESEKLTMDEYIAKYPEISKEKFKDLHFISPYENQLSLFEVTEIESEAKKLTHLTLPTTALTNFLKQFMNNPTRIENPRKGRVSIEEHYLTKDTIITYKGEGAEYTIGVERVKELFAKRVQNGAKIFNFLLQKLNEQNYQENTEFLLSELVEAGIYANPDSAYRGLKTVLDKLMRIHVEGKITTYQGRKKKEVANTKAAIISARTVTYNKCAAVLPPILRNSAPSITILPRWSYALQNENAYILLDYIYYLARQNTDKIKERGYFTINLDTIRQHIGLPSPEEVQKGNYNKLIIKPIEDAITAIEDGQQGDELKITPIYNPDYKNIHEYLNGYIEIKLDGAAFAYMEQRAIKEEKQKTMARRLKAKNERAKDSNENPEN